MRKTLVLFTAFVMLLCVVNVSYADTIVKGSLKTGFVIIAPGMPDVTEEDFSMRQGLNFNMTKDEVIAHEKKVFGHTPEVGLGGAYMCGAAGMELKDVNLSVCFYFDKSDRLSEIRYIANRGTANDYKALQQQAIDALGQPDYTEKSGKRITGGWMEKTSYDISAFSQWLIEYDEYFAFVELYTYKNMLGYQTLMGFLVQDK